jgi:hypothetical protein
MLTEKENYKNSARIISVTMGYGHDRAAHPLKHMAYQNMIIKADDFAGIYKKDKRIWRRSKRFYEFISNFKNFPILGEPAFWLFDQLQKIPDFYPKRDLSTPNLYVKYTHNLIKKGWLKSLLFKLNKKKLPVISSFFLTAHVLDYWGYQGDNYIIVTDTDVSRNWVPLKPQKSKIYYLAPTYRVVERLKLYGVPEKNIYLTGFPLPKKNIMGENMELLKSDIGKRLFNLDPKKRFISKYFETIEKAISKKNIIKKSKHPLTLAFAVGGAGAQKNIGKTIIQSLKNKIKKREIKLILIAGTRSEVYKYFKDCVITYGLKKFLNKEIKIVFANNKTNYFNLFNKILRKTDILWTKPSELSFYAGLGIPIIMAPHIGSQEIFNYEWLITTGAGIPQLDPRYTNEWLFDWINSGWLAKAALEGFLYAPKMGTYNIEKILRHKKLKLEKPTLIY